MLEDYISVHYTCHHTYVGITNIACKWLKPLCAGYLFRQHTHSCHLLLMLLFSRASKQYDEVECLKWHQYHLTIIMEEISLQRFSKILKHIYSLQNL